MKLLQYRSRSREVYTLCEMLNRIGYSVPVSDSFTLAVDMAVKDFQKKNHLVVDGIVGMKTWQKLFEKTPKITDINDLFLSESDLMDFANEFNVELAAIKAVNEVESSGKGFLINGKPKILFEGHVFWKQLEKRNFRPENLLTGSYASVLYQKWTRNFYLGGVGEYDRLNHAITLSNNPQVEEAALASCSWGSFQIMGYHAESLGYGSVRDFVAAMKIHEREHLKAFGKFLVNNKIMPHLQTKNWASFAKAYNGPSYQHNKYDEKLKRAYQKYA